MTTAAPTKTKRPARSRSARSSSSARPTGSGSGTRIGELRTVAGPPRELIERPGAAGSRLIIDRDSSTGSDERLIAHLAADEPRGNAALICRLYADAEPEQRRCRPVEEPDESRVPIDGREAPPVPCAVGEAIGVELQELTFRLEQCASRMSIPELRWTATSPIGPGPRTVSLRDAIAAGETYEPLCSMTRAAIDRFADEPLVSTTTLRAELARVLDSPIVLNRALREAVLARVAREGSSLSEIAIRCGRVKRDGRGNQSGETSWLARRMGSFPRAGRRNRPSGCTAMSSP